MAQSSRNPACLDQYRTVRCDRRSSRLLGNIPSHAIVLIDSCSPLLGTPGRRAGDEGMSIEIANRILSSIRRSPSPPTPLFPEYRGEGENMLTGWATTTQEPMTKNQEQAFTLFHAGQSMGWHRATWSEALERIDRLLDSKLDANRMKFSLDRFRQQIGIDCNPGIDH